MPGSPATTPELLAPAGDWEAMRSAVANGADAVYFGLSLFNARHRATNFTLEELPDVIAYLHGHNVRGYVTFNTLIFSDELPEAVRFVSAVAAAGADAVIVQDLGLARLIHRVAPTLAVHGSTQMTLTEPRGIEFVRGLGVERVILARELSAADVGRITAATDVPVEVFIHGALCVSYSGQCLTSEAIGGRSANRGQCAQACRLPYDLIVDGRHTDLGDKAYLLSPQDLAAYDLIADLAGLGVVSFKIEGRLKSAQYVAAATQTYRAAIDAAIDRKPFTLSQEGQRELALSFSRGFTHGFFDGVNHQTLVPARFPKSRGLRAGTVLATTLDGVLIDPVTPLKIGDGVVFDEGHPEQNEQGGRLLAVVPRAHASSRRAVEITFRRGDLNLQAIAPGAIVWKTDDPAVRKKLEQSYAREDVARRVPLNFYVTATVGGPLRITAAIGDQQATAEWPGPLALAQKFPITLDTLREQLGRLGDSPFELAALDAPALPPVMVPKSVLNDLRRQVVAQLLAAREKRHAVADPAALDTIREEIAPKPSASTPPSLSVLVRTLEQLEAALAWRGSTPLERVYAEFEDVRRYPAAVAAARTAGVPIAIATTRIIKPTEEGLLKYVAECEPDAVLVRNLAGLSYFRQMRPQMPLIGDYALNVSNELTAALFVEHGVGRLTPSYDLSWKQLTAMLRRFSPERFETVVHQNMPLFHTEHCTFAATLSTGKDYRDCGRPCESKRVDLRDRAGVLNPLIADVGCRNTVYNGQAQTAAEYVPRMLTAGFRHFRVELLRETVAEATALLERYADVIAGKLQPRAAFRSLRVLNQLGVSAGTLDRD